MVELLNGKDDGPMAGFVIASVGAVTLIGKMHDRTNARPDRLSPVQELKTAIVGTPEGMRPVHQCFPLFLLDIREVELPEGALIVRCESLSRLACRMLAQRFAAGEELQQQARTAESGIAVAKAMPRIG